MQIFWIYEFSNFRTSPVLARKLPDVRWKKSHVNRLSILGTPHPIYVHTHAMRRHDVNAYTSPVLSFYRFSSLFRPSLSAADNPPSRSVTRLQCLPATVQTSVRFCTFPPACTHARIAASCRVHVRARVDTVPRNPALKQYKQRNTCDDDSDAN